MTSEVRHIFIVPRCICENLGTYIHRERRTPYVRSLSGSSCSRVAIVDLQIQHLPRVAMRIITRYLTIDSGTCTYYICRYVDSDNSIHTYLVHKVRILLNHPKRQLAIIPT